LARQLDVPASTATQLLDLVIADACAQQGVSADAGQGGEGAAPVMLAGMEPMPDSPRLSPLLRRLPPPRRLVPLLRGWPAGWRHSILERAIAGVRATALTDS